MAASRYYSLRLYGHGPFPKFIDSLKTMATVDKWLSMAKADGYHTADILRDEPSNPGYVGITRELVRTVHWSAK